MKKSKKILIVIGILIIALICIFIILNKGNSETGEITYQHEVTELGRKASKENTQKKYQKSVAFGAGK